MKAFTINAKVWKYPGPACWHFVYASDAISKRLKEAKDVTRVALGYVKVRAKLGKTEWDTTLFPSKEGPYLLAIKAPVRKAEGIDEGDSVRIRCSPL